ncbi:MAG TPA: hypothetical protein V6D33_13470 [Cyanophyceae cyanobacterium]
MSQILLSDLCDRANISYSGGLAIALSFRKTKKHLAIFHCQKTPVQLSNFGTGFPEFPWRCPCCQTLVRQEAEVSYDVLLLQR